MVAINYSDLFFLLCWAPSNTLLCVGSRYVCFLCFNHSTATLPNKSRRATGIGSRRMPTYEDTDLDHHQQQQQQQQSAVVNRVLRKSSSPSPLHSSGGGSGRSLESSPKLPSPYQSKKQLRLSPSLGDVAELGKTLTASQHSSTSSLNRLSDTDNDAYEPISDFLRHPSPSSSSSPSTTTAATAATMSTVPAPMPPTIVTPAPNAFEHAQSGFSPPSYPAPVPPGKNLSREVKKLTSSKERLDKMAEGKEEEDEDDDGYTPVKVEKGQVSIQEFRDGVERAVLPFFSSSSTRSSATSSEGTFSTHGGGSPMKGGEGHRHRTPSNPETSGGGSVSTTSKKGFVIPPEPTSPPPSPPPLDDGSSRGDLPPKSPSPLLTQQHVSHDGGCGLSSHC